MVGQETLYVISAVLMVRTEPTADDSLAAILDLSKFGMAMAAMIRMIATTIKSSMSENPFCFFMSVHLLERKSVPERVLERKSVPERAVPASSARLMETFPF